MRIAALWVGLLLLAGCGGQGPEGMLEDYLDRVENTLDLTQPPRDPYGGLMPLPGKRERRLPVTELRAGVLETLDFKHCGLLPLIAERNSILGRVMKPSTVLSYELRFFDRLEACYRQDQRQMLKDPEFSELLGTIYRTKAANLPRVVWNGIFTSEALERNLSLAAPPLPLEGNPGYGDSLRALEKLADIRSRVEDFTQGQPLALPPGLEALEQDYAALHHSEYGSQLINSLLLLSHYLGQTAATLESALARRPLCFGGPNERARILKNVFTRYYADRVLPYMAQIQREGGPWMERLAILMRPPGTPLPPAMLAYHRQLLGDEGQPGLWEHYQRAIRRHTHAWQEVLGQCDLMPQGSPSTTVG